MRGVRVSCADRVGRVQCSICLCDYEDGDNVRLLLCRHSFHVSCLEPWLKVCLCARAYISWFPLVSPAALVCSVCGAHGFDCNHCWCCPGPCTAGGVAVHAVAVLMACCRRPVGALDDTYHEVPPRAFTAASLYRHCAVVSQSKRICPFCKQDVTTMHGQRQQMIAAGTDPLQCGPNVRLVREDGSPLARSAVPSSPTRGGAAAAAAGTATAAAASSPAATSSPRSASRGSPPSAAGTVCLCAAVCVQIRLLLCAFAPRVSLCIIMHPCVCVCALWKQRCRTRTRCTSRA